MTINADRLGPGRLTFGEAGTTTEFGSQVTKAALEPESEDGEVITVLSGEELVDGDTDSYKLTGEFYQDYTTGMSSLIVWCKSNANTELAYEFIPSTTGKLGVRGRCRIKPVKVGGDVKKRNTTEFSFTGVGDYEFYDPTPDPAPEG